MQLSFTRKISHYVRETESMHMGNFRMTLIDLRTKMFSRLSFQGIKQYITMGSSGKTGHSNQARAVPIKVTRPEAIRTTTTNKEFLFCT